MAKPADTQFDLLGEFMAQHYWVAGRSELVGLGFSDHAIDGWLKSRRLVRLFRGVFGYGRDVETKRSAWRAALLASGPPSALTAWSSSEFWGLVRTEDTIPARIQVASPTRKAARFAGRSPALARVTLQAHRRSFEEGEYVLSDGLWVTTAPRTLIDLVVDAGPVTVKFAFLEACRLGLFGRTDVAYCFRRVSGRRGARKLSPLLALWVPELSRIRSVLEGMFLLAWAERNRHRMPLVNHKLCGCEVDCYWPEQRLVVELDGGAFHSHPLARARDQAKDQSLRANGFRVFRFGYDEVRYTPESTVGKVTRHFDPP